MLDCALSNLNEELMELQVIIEYKHGLWFVSVEEAGHFTRQETKRRWPGYSIFEKAVQAAIEYAEAENLPVESWDLMNGRREVLTPLKFDRS